MRVDDNDCAAVILAAGQGTRMRSRLPKVLHRVAGRAMLLHVLDAVESAGLGRVVTVIGHGASQVREVIGERVEWVEQTERLGTGHAVLQARELLEGKQRNVLVTYGDMPLLQPETLQRLVRHHRESGGPITIATCVANNPSGYGRIVRNRSGQVTQVVEEAEASPDQRLICEVNVGICCYSAEWLWPHLAQIRPNSKGEYYLTDLPAIAAEEGLPVASIDVGSMAEVAGINDRVQLAEAEAILRDRIRQRLMLSGVTLIDPRSTFVDSTVKVGVDTVIYPNTFLEGSTVVGSHCEIGPFSRILDCHVGDGARIVASFIEQSEIGDGTSIGPFSRLRPGTKLAANVYVGNFAEMKNSSVDSGSRVQHFSYLGDAAVGRNVNVGAGTITCNFNHETRIKSKTTIEDGVALGSDTLLVAPVRIGSEAATGAGAVVTRDVPSGMVAFGMPAKVVRRKKKPAQT